LPAAAAELEFTVYQPGAASGGGKAAVYEDDGNTTAYVKGTFARTAASYTIVGGSDLEFTVATSSSCGGLEAAGSGGSAAACATAAFLPATRPITLKLVNSLPPTSVEVDGQALAFSRYPGARGLHPKGTWHYEGDAAMLVINAAAAPPAKGVRISVKGAVATTAHTALVRSRAVSRLIVATASLLM
jgi:hypothetical protein